MGLISKLFELSRESTKDEENGSKDLAGLAIEIKDRMESIASTFVGMMDTINRLEDVIVIHQRAIEELYKVQKMINQSISDKTPGVHLEPRKTKVEKPN